MTEGHQVRYTGCHVLPMPLRIGRANVSEIGEQARARLMLAVGGEMAPVLERLGGRAARFDRIGSGHLASSFFGQPDGTFRVDVPFELTRERQRVDVAQAIGHQVLHRPAALAAHPDLPMSVPYWAADESDPGLRLAIKEAIWFSWALLMPEREFRAEWNRTDGSVATLAQAFRVPGRVVGHRAVTLGLAEPEPQADAASPAP
jgi:hypothetical protein